MYKLNSKEISFPDPSLYNPADGLIAIGGDLSLPRVWFAYQNGIFPWYDEGEVLWWCPDPRFVLYPKDIRISKSMQKILDRNIFSFTENKSFEEVIKNCQMIKRKDQGGTWITHDMYKAYVGLHKEGKAKSIEVWQQGELVGGFYGVVVGEVFCGESMFSKVSNASKAAFIQFVLQYKKTFELIDCQVYTKHLESLGAKMINKSDYFQILKKGIR